MRNVIGPVTIHIQRDPEEPDLDYWIATKIEGDMIRPKVGALSPVECIREEIDCGGIDSIWNFGKPPSDKDKFILKVNLIYLVSEDHYWGGMDATSDFEILEVIEWEQ